jgi:hypothetical protein
MVGKLTFGFEREGAATLPWLPLAAVVEGDGRRASAFIVEGGIAKRRAIEIAFIDRDHVALASGLNVGAVVVTDGALYLADGDRVQVRKD